MLNEYLSTLVKEGIIKEFTITISKEDPSVASVDLVLNTPINTVINSYVVGDLN